MNHANRWAPAMPPGAWGRRAQEWLERARRHDVSIYRVGELSMLSPPDFVTNSWSGWLFGVPRDRGQLAIRFEHGSPENLPAALGRALDELGLQACELLCDRFVLVAYDHRRDRCLVTRDQLGAQPLIHTQASGGVLFAEHECDLIDLLPSTPPPDRLALLQWIENGLHPFGCTLYKGLCRLPAGHRLVLDKGSTRVERWWRLSYEGTDQGSPDALPSRVRDLALTAVGQAAAGARRPAVKLSGGLDSACVAAGLAAGGFADGRGLAIGGTFSGFPVTDESDLMQATARYTNLPLEQVPFDANSSMLSPALVHLSRWRLPPATPNLFLWRPVMARARELGVDVMLDGEGGDELFGLAPYLIADRLSTGRIRSAWSLAGQIPGSGGNPSLRLRLRTLRHLGLSPLAPEALARRGHAQTGTSSIVPQADARALAALSTKSREEQREGPLWWRFHAESLIDLRDGLDMGGHYRRQNADDELDRRHPFLHDLQLVEAMLRIPPETQFDPLRDRVLLREGMAGLIPEAVRYRYEKSHFTPVVLSGLRADEDGLLNPLRRADAPIRDYVSTGALDGKIGVPPERRSMFEAGAMWRLGIANLWLISQPGVGS